MLVNSDDVKKIANLIKIEVKTEEVSYYSNELSKIMDWIAQLRQVDTSGVEPMITTVSQVTPLRDDVAIAQDRDAVTINAPKTCYGFYSVPKMIE